MSRSLILNFWIFLLFLLFQSGLHAEIDLTNYSGVLSGQHTPVSTSNSATQLTDNNNATYLSVGQSASWVQYKAYSPFIIQSYSVTSAPTSATNDPTGWTFQGSKNGTTWVTLNTQSNQTFTARGQKKTYAVANDSFFTYYRLQLTNSNAATINLAEWELFLPSAWNGFVFPTVSITTTGSGTTTGESAFFQAIDVPRAQHVCLGVNHLLYRSAAEVPAFTKLNLIVDPNDLGIAGKGGAPPEITIQYGGNNLSNYYTNSGLDAVITEIVGIMYHEVTHAYTQEPNNAGTYVDGTNFHTFIEGIADYIRYKAGYTSVSSRAPSDFYYGYKPAAFFIDWITRYKDPDFAYLFNLTSQTMPNWTWDKATRQILDMSVEHLWKEYQVYLKNTGSNVIAEYVLDDRRVNVNTPVSFINLSANATSYLWSFPGGTPATSTAQSPSVSYAQSGIYNVILQANNGGSSSVKGDTAYVVVGLYNTAMLNGLSATNTPVATETGKEATDGSEQTKVLMQDMTTTQITCDAYTPLLLRAYVVQGTNLNDNTTRFPTTWKLKGSNDGVNWTVIDSRSGQTHPSISYGRRAFRLPNNTTPYAFYKMDEFANSIPAGTASDYIAMSELELYTTSIDSTIADITDDGGLLTAQYQTGSPNGEEYTKAIDNNITSKYLTFNCSAWIQYQAVNVYRPIAYFLTSARDEPTRDPKNWTLQASVDGVNWTTLDTRTNEVFPTRYQEKQYPLNVTASYRYYRFNFTCNGTTSFQIGEIRIIGQEQVSCPIAPSAPIAGPDQTGCAGQTTLTVSVGAGNTADWYASASGGAPLLAGSTNFSPTVSGTYYAETFNSSTGCKSTTRTPISATVYPAATLTVGSTVCASDLLSYSFSFSSNTAVTSTAGTVDNTAKTVTGVPAGTDVVLTAVLGNCQAQQTVVSPNCSCPDISTAPVMSNIGAVSATATWSAVPGLTGYELQYRAVGAATWNTIAVSSTVVTRVISGLISATAYEVRLRAACSNTGLYGAYSPIVQFTTAASNDITDRSGTLTAQYQTGSPNGEDYTKVIDNNFSTKYLTFNCATWIQFQATDAYICTGYTLVSANDAPERDPKNWTFQVSNDGVSWTTLDTRTGEVFATRFLEKNYSVTTTTAYRYFRFNFTCNSGTIFQLAEIQIWGQPLCTAPAIPVSGGNQAICSGQTIPALTATVTAGNTVDWYNAATGGTLLLSGNTSYTPTAAGTYYAEARNTTTNCKSSTRTAISLTINTAPTLTLSATTCAPNLLTYTINFASTGTVTSTAGTVDNTAKTVSSIPAGTNVTLTATLNGCTTTLAVTAPSCTCPTVTAPVSGGNQTICSNQTTPALTATSAGNTVDWYSAATGGTLLLSGNTSYTPTAAGTYYAEARNTMNGCTSSTRTAVTLAINTAPTLTVSGTTCAPNLLTYNIDFTSTGTVTSTAGTVDNTAQTVSSIATGTNVTLTATLNGCTVQVAVTSPSCSCPTVTAAVSGGNQTVCADQTIPALTATVDAGNTVDWYSAATGGTLLLSGNTSYTPAVAGTYYAEARNTTTNCKSTTRTAVTLTINTAAVASSGTVCSPDLLTYTINFTSTGTVTSTAGTVDNTAKTVSGIPAGTNVTLTATNNGCTAQVSVTAPSCTCATVTAPVSGGNQTICSDQAIPALTATSAGNTVDWYSAATGGSLLLSGSTSYTPTAAGTYYAEARNTTNGCTSGTRTAITLTINTLPTLTTSGTTCAANLLTYTINFASNGTVTSTAGTVDNTAQTVSGIATGTNVTLTATLNGCTTTLAVSSPSCPCPTVTAAVSGGDQTICAGQTIPALTATVDAGNTVDWYSAATGGTLLLSGNTSYTPTAAGTYYAEARNTTNNCKSATRTAVALTINALPTLTLSSTTCAADLLTYTINFASNGTVTSTAGTVDNTAKTVTGIAAGTNVTLTATLNGCTATLAVTSPVCQATPVDITNDGGLITAQYQTGSPVNEDYTKAIDNSITSKYLTFNCSAWVQYQSSSAYFVTSYTLTSGNDSPERDPKNWTLQASNDGATWTTLDTRSNETFATRRLTRTFTISTPATAYKYFRINFTCSSGTILQFSEWEIFGTLQPACTTLAAPVSGGNQTVCAGQAIPALTATSTGNTVDWYSAATGGTLLLSGNTSYTPTAAGTYYAEARSTTNNCISATRTAVTLTINALPTLTLSSTTCVGTTTYTIAFASTGTVTSTAGTVDNTAKTVTGITAGTNVTLTATLNGCTVTLAVTSPSCACPAPSATPTVSSILNTSAVISWGAVSGATGYIVEYKTTAGTTWTVANSNVTTTSYTLTGLASLVSYQVRIKTKCGTTTTSATYSPTLQFSTLGAEVDITDYTGTLSAQYQTGSPTNEGYTKVIDNSNTSKYLTFNCSAWIQFYAAKTYVVTRYSLVSANDNPQRDPKNWTFQGSNDGATWVTLNTQTNQAFATRALEKTYTFTNSVGYRYYRINITCNGGTEMQMAEWRIYGREQIAAKPGGGALLTESSVQTSPNVSVLAYPNPVSNTLTINTEGSDSAPLYLHLYDVLGRMVKMVNLEGATMTEIDMEKLQAGMYQAVVTFGDRSRATVKVMKVE